jgi:hypothetical protein
MREYRRNDIHSVIFNSDEFHALRRIEWVLAGLIRRKDYTIALMRKV